MKVECVREKLHTAVSQAEKVTGKNLSLPVLGAIFMEAKNSVLRLRTTNLNVGVEIDIPAKVEREGVVAVNGSILNTILNQIKSDKSITLENIEGNVSVTTPHSSMLIKSYSPDDFPTLPKVSSTTTFSLSIEKLLEGIKAVSYSSAVSDIKPEIACVYIYPEEGELIFVATDSFRLGEKKIKVKKVADFSGVLIPIKNINDIVKVFSQEKGEIECVIGENQIAFKNDAIYMTSRLVDGVFPDYRQIIPKDFTTEITTLTQDMLQALRVIDIFSDKFNQVNISVSSEEKTCLLSTKSDEVGENETLLEAAITGEEINTSINHKYLADVFQSISTDSMTLHFVAPNKPLVVNGVGDKTFTYLIMPMNR